MDKYTPLRSQNEIQEIASNGVLICMDQQGRSVPPNVDITYPYIIITLTVSNTTDISASLVNATPHSDQWSENSEKRIVNSGVYDLSGRKMANPTRGLYIVNGRKVTIK